MHGELLDKHRHAARAAQLQSNLQAEVLLREHAATRQDITRNLDMQGQVQDRCNPCPRSSQQLYLENAHRGTSNTGRRSTSNTRRRSTSSASRRC